MIKKLFAGLFGLAMMLPAVSAFTQEATIGSWAYGLEGSLGVKPEAGIFSNYSASFQGMTTWGGLSLDWIQGAKEEENQSGLKYMRTESGLLGSLFLELPIGDVFGLYGGGGLGFGFGGEDIAFAWKVDAGALVWLADLCYVKSGVVYDNIRDQLGISVGVGFKLEKEVTATYRNGDGTTFQRRFTKFLWEDNSTSNYVYADEFLSSELVNRYQKTTTASAYIAPKYEMKTSGGETVTTTLKDQYGRTIGTATSRTEERMEYVETEGSKYETHYYVYNVTVTRNWYTRTYYYKDRAPTTQKIYQDVESAVLVDTYTRTQ